MISANRDALYAAFRQKAVEPDTLFLLNARDALEFLNAGTLAGLVLAGVEGFSVTDMGAYEPRQDFSNDYADCRSSRVEFEKQTRDLLRRGEAVGVRFQVVFEPAQ